MKRLHFLIKIEAPKEKVWNTMLQDSTFREWCSEFAPGSHVKGTWGRGNNVQFLSPDENGNFSGMTSTIVEFIPYQYVSIHHRGVVNNGQEDTTSEEARQWVGFENYAFQELLNRTTELSV